MGADHLGRLAGYSNRKEQRTLPDGRHPWVRLHEAEGRLAPAAEPFLAEVRAAMTAERAAPPPDRVQDEPGHGRRVLDTQPARTDATGPALTPAYLAQEFGVRAARILERQQARDGRVDPSAADWAVVGTMHERYPWLSAAQLAQAMRTGSPRIEERHRGHVADYVGRTVVKALRAQRESQESRTQGERPAVPSSGGDEPPR